MKSEALKSDLAIGDLQFKIAELHNNYQRRTITELRETDRSLLELTVTLPSAQRARIARARQIGWLTTEHGQPPPLVVIRTKDSTTSRHDATVDFRLQPGDVVQVGSLLPTLDTPANPAGPSRQRSAEGQAP